jgi:hypothetical protein
VFSASDQRGEQVAPRARALTGALAEVAAELRLIDVAELVAFIRTENHPNISDLVSSSLELYFKPDLLRYGWGADARVRWGEPPALAFDMEFRHLGVTVFFRLLLESSRAWVELNYVALEGASASPEENTRRILAAIADARIPEALPPVLRDAGPSITA